MDFLSMADLQREADYQDFSQLCLGIGALVDIDIDPSVEICQGDRKIIRGICHFQPNGYNNTNINQAATEMLPEIQILAY